MKIIKTSPKNELHFKKLKRFASEVLKICNNLNTEPIAWGSLAIFGYTKNKKLSVNDFDFLIPKNASKKIKTALEKSGFRCNLVKEWNCLQVFKDNLKIELDPIEYYKIDLENLEEFNFEDFKIKVVGLKNLKKMYKDAYNKPYNEHDPEMKSKYKAKFEMLDKIK